MSDEEDLVDVSEGRIDLAPDMVDVDQALAEAEEQGGFDGEHARCAEHGVDVDAAQAGCGIAAANTNISVICAI
jgi:hypothetical protein